MFYRRLDHLRQALQGDKIPFLEGTGAVREQLEYAKHFLAAKQRHDYH